jgi:hypothetical protein
MRLGPDFQRIWIDAAVPFGTASMATLSAFVFLALIFSLTHSGTIIFRHSTRGLLFCVGVLIGYLFLGWEIYLHQPSWSPHVPDVLFQPFIDFPRNMHLVPGAISSVLARVAILPLFPFIAQLFLGRAEV